MVNTIGRILGGHYQIARLLSNHGGFSETYLAADIHLPDKPLRVVKKLKPQFNQPQLLQNVLRLFNTEAEVLYGLGENEFIPKLFAHFEESGEFYLVQEYIEGHDLSQEINQGKQLDEQTTIVILRDILEVLETVHRQNVIHRDIKPANLIRRNSDGKIELIDFGAVKQISITNNNGQNIRTIPVGTPGYMPPEQREGRPQLSSDIYAVGMLGIAALTGIPPHQLPINSNTLEVVWKDRVSVSGKLARVLDKMVAYNCNSRYQNASEALQAVRDLLPDRSPDKKPKLKWWIVGLIGGIIIASGGAFLWGNREQPPNQPTPPPTDDWVW